MPTKYPRINVVLEEPVYSIIEELAKIKGLSMSMVTRELIKEAIEVNEDLYLTSFADERSIDFDESQAMSHEEVWD